jgi:hypothetical protein
MEDGATRSSMQATESPRALARGYDCGKGTSDFCPDHEDMLPEVCARFKQFAICYFEWGRDLRRAAECIQDGCDLELPCALPADDLVLPPEVDQTASCEGLRPRDLCERIGQWAGDLHRWASAYTAWAVCVHLELRRPDCFEPLGAAQNALPKMKPKVIARLCDEDDDNPNTRRVCVEFREWAFAAEVWASGMTDFTNRILEWREEDCRCTGGRPEANRPPKPPYRA